MLEKRKAKPNKAKPKTAKPKKAKPKEEKPEKERESLFKEYRDAHAGKVGTVEKTKKAKLKRISSGVAGLDNLIEGGYKQQSTILVSGGPGSGKTTLLLQFLQAGAEKGEAGLYVSFEETEESLMDDFSAFSWGLTNLKKKGKLFFLTYPPHQVDKIMAQGGGMIKDIIREHKVKRVSIDSLTGFALLYKSEYEKRTSILRFFKMLQSWGCTVLLASEQTATLEANIQEHGLEFLVDGALLLYNIRIGNKREQGIEVLKMRGTDISRKICPLSITKNGIRVFPGKALLTSKSQA